MRERACQGQGWVKDASRKAQSKEIEREKQGDVELGGSVVCKDGGIHFWSGPDFGGGSGWRSKRLCGILFCL